MKTENTSKKQAAKESILFAFSVAALVAAVGGCGYLLVLFHVISYLPMKLLVVLRVLCVAAIGLSIGFFRAYLQTRE